MIIIMKKGTDKAKVEALMSKLKEKNLTPVPLYGTEKTVVAVIGNTRDSVDNWSLIDGVDKVIRILKSYKLASREYKEHTVIDVGGVKIGGDEFIVIAGPCAVENEEQLMKAAEIVKKNGVKILRASAFKPRTSPYAFQGMGIAGLKLLRKIRERTGLLVETEVMDVRDVKVCAEYVDIIRIGARNMQNFDLLKEVGKVKRPVILKRGMSATLNEFIMAAEYILSNGNMNVILCERGIRTFETAYRNTLDITAVPALKKMTHLPVIVDPSHAAGEKYLIPALSRASVAAGADGLLVEVHPSPQEAMSDAEQSLNETEFASLMKSIEPICLAVGRKLSMKQV
jgi:3-deoxy-7-phosphoheptulonate synthase